MASEPDAASEQRPLLADSQTADHGTLERNADASAAVEEQEPSTLHILGVMSSVWLGSLLAAVDGTLVATLSAPIAGSFHSLSLISWLASGFFIANAALQPLAGKLTDIFGRRSGLVFSNVVFAIGNLICGLARDERTMILGRVVAGCGGGGLTAISTFIASDLVPLRRRGVWQGIGNIVYGSGAAIGGVFGGIVNDTLGWRWAFFIQVPLTVLSVLLVIFVVKLPGKGGRDDGGESGVSPWKRIDFLGAGLLVVTLVLLLMGLNSGGNVVPWTHPLVLTTLPLGFLAMLAYIYVEARVASEPIIPVRLLARRTVLASCLTNWFTTMAFFGLYFYVPIYFQARGYTSTQVGERVVVQSLGVGIGSFGVGVLMRWLGRYYWVNVGVQVTIVLGMALVATLDRYTPDVPPYFYFIIVGAGYSGMLTVTLVSLISAVEHRFQAVITSASYAFRSTGSTLGITIASAVFQNVLTTRLWDRLGDRDGADDFIPRVRDSLDEIKKLPVDWQNPIIDSYMDACRAVFLTLLGIAVLSAVASLFIREHKLYNTMSRRDS